MRKLAFLAAILMLLVSAGAPAGASAALDFSNTYGVIAGVLEWKDTTLTSFSKDARKDEELRDTLVARGTPARNLTLLLDREATKGAIVDALERTASRAPAGSTLLFYYAGHGLRRSGTDAYFANYDIDKDKAETTGLAVSSIGDAIRRLFKGSRVILMADCCYSGALARETEKLNGAGIATVCLASSSSSNMSTANWTFTQTIIDDLVGDPLADANRDGDVSLEEVAGEVHRAMKCRERQVAGVIVPAQMQGAAVARASEKVVDEVRARPFMKGEYVLGYRESRWRPARVLRSDGAAYRVQFYSYSRKAEARLEEKDMKKLTFVSYRAGTKAPVEWLSRYYDAEVLDVRDDFHLVTYPGWEPYWNEWVAYDRIDARTLRKSVEAQWGGQWYPALALLEEKGRSFVHYEGFDYTWDEWVASERIRARKGDSALRRAPDPLLEGFSLSLERLLPGLRSGAAAPPPAASGAPPKSAS